LDLDANIATDIAGYSLALGQIRVYIYNGDMDDDNPIIDTNTPPFYTGFIGVTLPSTGAGVPSQVKKQRICFVIRADGVNS
jgi:hypothetical protein